MKQQINFRASNLTAQQLEHIMGRWGTSQTETLTVIIDRIYRQEISTVTTETVTHKYNLSSNMSHRINFDQMVECRLAEVQAAYGDEVGDWHLYFDLDELDVDDEAEAAARIESIWPVLARPGDFGIIVWIGPGWYAPRSIRNDIWYYCCGDNRDQEPDTYTKGLGSPDWYDEPPVWMETR